MEIRTKFDLGQWIYAIGYDYEDMWHITDCFCINQISYDDGGVCYWHTKNMTGIRERACYPSEEDALKVCKEKNKEVIKEREANREERLKEEKELNKREIKRLQEQIKRLKQEQKECDKRNAQK